MSWVRKIQQGGESLDRIDDDHTAEKGINGSKKKYPSGSYDGHAGESQLKFLSCVSLLSIDWFCRQMHLDIETWTCEEQPMGVCG